MKAIMPDSEVNTFVALSGPVSFLKFCNIEAIEMDW